MDKNLKILFSPLVMKNLTIMYSFFLCENPGPEGYNFGLLPPEVV